MSSARRRARYNPPDRGHWNAGKLGWAYPPGTYDPEMALDEEGWTFEPDDENESPNFAVPEHLDFDVQDSSD